MSDSLYPHGLYLPDSSAHGILQAKILEWVAMPSSRGSSRPRDWILISYISCTGRWVLTTRLTWEATWRSSSQIKYSPGDQANAHQEKGPLQGSKQQGLTSSCLRTMRSGCYIDEKDAVSSWCSGGGACQSQELRQWAWPKGPITVLTEPVTAFLIETRLLDIKVMELSFSLTLISSWPLAFAAQKGRSAILVSSQWTKGALSLFSILHQAFACEHGCPGRAHFSHAAHKGDF